MPMRSDDDWAGFILGAVIVFVAVFVFVVGLILGLRSVLY